MTVSLYPKTTVWFRHKVPRGASFKVQWCFLLKICEKYCGFILVYLGFSDFSKPTSTLTEFDIVNRYWLV